MSDVYAGYLSSTKRSGMRAFLSLTELMFLLIRQIVSAHTLLLGPCSPISALAGRFFIAQCGPLTCRNGRGLLHITSLCQCEGRRRGRVGNEEAMPAGSRRPLPPDAQATACGIEQEAGRYLLLTASSDLGSSPASSCCH